MIFYFSGTGNSRHIAKSLAGSLDETLIELSKSDSGKISFSGDSLGFVFPVYSWGVPPVVIDFIKNLNNDFFNAIRNSDIFIWAVLSCGDETGMAPEMLRKELECKGCGLHGCWSVIMPNNYVILPGFNTDPKDVENRKLRECDSRISIIKNRIREKVTEYDVVRGTWPRLKTAVVYPLFKNFGIYPKRWKQSTECIKCGICKKRCPVDNITMNDSGPIWGDNCTSCLACYHYCPQKCIQYGKATLKKGHYHFPD